MDCVPLFWEQHLQWLHKPILEWQSIVQSVQTKCGILNCVRTWRLSSYCPLLSCSALLIPCFTACLKEGRSTAMSSQLVSVPFARVLESELWATCGCCATFYLAIHQILGDAPFVHLRDMSKPAKPKFTEHCIDSCCPSLAKNIIFGDLVLPCVSHDLAETSTMESIQTVHMSGILWAWHAVWGSYLFRLCCWACWVLTSQ